MLRLARKNAKNKILGWRASANQAALIRLYAFDNIDAALMPTQNAYLHRIFGKIKMFNAETRKWEMFPISLTSFGLLLAFGLWVTAAVAQQQQVNGSGALIKLASNYDQKRRTNVAIYLDQSRVLRDGPMRRVFVLLDFDRVQEEHIGYRYLSILRQEEIHCNQSGWRNIEELVFSGGMASGQVIKRNIPRQNMTSSSNTTFNATVTPNQIAGSSTTQNFGAAENYRTITPNSLVDKVYQRVCR